MQPINFYDDSEHQGREPEDVRLKQLGLYVHEDGRRIAVGFNITPFRERPSIEVTASNGRGEAAGSLTIIEALQSNFSLTMHLRDAAPTEEYTVRAELYYVGSGGERQIVDSKETTVDVTVPGETIIS
ncbi:MAG TPA: hypothetical protein VK879_22835 [Candidatus Sulfomarinibacteraceae bacterium]|nr:hypothetical protein [Candidatus Sulfomarinibacteraceae bacterium]